MPSRNRMIHSTHFHKHWMDRIKTWFFQPGHKRSRRVARVAKAKAIFPRPITGPLRPAVRPPTQRYNMRLRQGRGFTLQELKEVGLTPSVARTIGISFDKRRKNWSEESFRLNVQRLRLYKSKLLLFPVKPHHPKKGDASPAELKKVTQITNPKSKILPIRQVHEKFPARAITEEERKRSVFQQLRMMRRKLQLTKRIKKNLKLKHRRIAKEAEKKKKAEAKN
ncbi:60S ribosomal protein L13 [Pelomyxa schiedti]|nr:60S ribosomal protein L13 [Pelomyxa schiedti]